MHVVVLSPSSSVVVLLMCELQRENHNQYALRNAKSLIIF